MVKLTDYIPSVEIDKICKRYHIKKLSLFGSALRGVDGPDSDVDILIEFEKGKTPGLITFCGLENELTDRIGRKVDLRTKNDLSRYFRDEVEQQAEVLYVAG